MSDPLKVRFKIGEIEFEAEGSAEDVELQRKAFMTDLLPEAVNAVIRTNSTGSPRNLSTYEPLLLAQKVEASPVDSSELDTIQSDFSRESLASYCASYGVLSEQDFVIIAAYYDEKKNGASSFSRESISRYYQEARRPKHSNFSELIKGLVKKGLIMAAAKVEGSSLLQYALTAKSLGLISNNEFSNPKGEKKTARKPKKTSPKIPSTYSNLCLDDLNLKKYPEVKLLSSLKQQVVMVMYIVSCEDKGDLFSVADIQCLVTDLWGLPSSTKTISNIFTANKSWFKIDKTQKGSVRRKLLEGGKDYARKTIEEFNTTTKK